MIGKAISCVVIFVYCTFRAGSIEAQLSMEDRVLDIYGPDALDEIPEIDYSLSKISATGSAAYGTTTLKDVDAAPEDRCFNVTVFYRTFDRHFNDIHTGHWDGRNGDSYTGGIVVYTLLHELYHSCTLETDATVMPSSCQHIAIEFSANQKACEQVTNFVDSAPPDDLATWDVDESEQFFADNPGDTDFMRGLCEAIEKRRSEFNTEENLEKVKACAMATPSPLSPVLEEAPDFCSSLRLPTTAELAASGEVLPPCEACAALPEGE